MTLKRFSYVVSTAFVGIIFIAGALLAMITSRMGENSSGTDNAIKSIRASEELQVQLLNHNREMLLAQLTKGHPDKAKYSQTGEKVLYWLAEAGKHVDPYNEREKALFEETAKAVKSYVQDHKEMTGSTLPRAFSSAELLTSLNVQQAEFYQRQLRSDDRLANWLSMLIIVLGVVAFPTFWILIRENIYRPIRALHHSIISFSGTEPMKAREIGLVETREIARAFNDLTERISEQRKAQVKFLAAVAHDLRNPLSAIKMSTELFTDESLTPNEALPIVQIIARQADQLDRMVGDLLDSTRIEAGQLELRIEKENIVPVINDAIRLYSSVSKLHRIVFSSDELQVVCACDRTRIGQVINNLLSNAIKYSPNGGVIEVKAGIQNGSAVIQVRDEGIGIAKDDLSQIFEPFRRTKLTKSSIPGVGLGLSVVKRIVRAHQGEILVESEPDKGTTFIIRIPLAKETFVQSSRELTMH